MAVISIATNGKGRGRDYNEPILINRDNVHVNVNVNNKKTEYSKVN